MLIERVFSHYYTYLYGELFTIARNLFDGSNEY